MTKAQIERAASMITFICKYKKLMKTKKDEYMKVVLKPNGKYTVYTIDDTNTFIKFIDDVEYTEPCPMDRSLDSLAFKYIGLQDIGIYSIDTAEVLYGIIGSADFERMFEKYWKDYTLLPLSDGAPNDINRMSMIMKCDNINRVLNIVMNEYIGRCNNSNIYVESNIHLRDDFISINSGKAAEGAKKIIIANKYIMYLFKGLIQTVKDDLLDFIIYDLPSEPTFVLDANIIKRKKNVDTIIHNIICFYKG